MQDASDELAIRSLTSAYTDAVNRRDGAGMAAVYAPNGELHSPAAGEPVIGTEKLAKRFKRLVEVEREFLFQMTHSGVVEIDGDRAQARWWFGELKKPTGKGYEYILGNYQDEVVRLDIGWRFAKRVVTASLRWDLPGEGISHSSISFFLPITGLPRP